MAPSVGHAELNDELNAYLDGELAADARARVDAHLTTCAVCQVELDQLRATRGALQALAPLRAPRPFTLEAPAPSDQGARAARAGRGVLDWLGWVWRLGSLATAACLLMALLTTNADMRRAGPSAALSVPEQAAEGFAPSRPGVLADQNSSQRVAPPAATPPPQGTAPPAAQAPQNQPPIPAGGAGGGLTQNESAQPPPPAPSAPATPQPGGAFSSAGSPASVRVDGAPTPAATPAAFPAGDARLAGAPTSRQGAEEVAERGRDQPVRDGTLWAGAALVTAAASATAFAVERRSRRANRL
jgi:hypothetical protein